MRSVTADSWQWTRGQGDGGTGSPVPAQRLLGKAKHLAQAEGRMPRPQGLRPPHSCLRQSRAARPMRTPHHPCGSWVLLSHPCLLGERGEGPRSEA